MSELAARLEFQVHYRSLPGGQGGRLKIGPRSQFTDQESQGAETVRISAGLAEPAHLQVGKLEQTGNVGNVGRVEDRAQLPPELASRPDIQELSGFVESHAFLPSDLYRMQKLGTPLSSKLISILSRIVNWASPIVIFAALAVAVVALWSLNGRPRPH